MTDSIPKETIEAFARSISKEAKKYGFGQVDLLRLINALMDNSADNDFAEPELPKSTSGVQGSFYVDSFPLRSERLTIELAEDAANGELLEAWMADQYGRYFLLSCATAQPVELQALLKNPHNQVGIVYENGATPIGAVAFLDIDQGQKRAELRKLIGAPDARGKGYAEEATSLWIQYGGEVLGLQKFYVSTLQTHLRNIQLNESIGFRVEGLLQREVLIGDERHDVLRMGLNFDEFRSRARTA